MSRANTSQTELISVTLRGIEFFRLFFRLYTLQRGAERGGYAAVDEEKRRDGNSNRIRVCNFHVASEHSLSFNNVTVAPRVFFYVEFSNDTAPGVFVYSCDYRKR